jgi:hypothetical protein
MEVFGCCSSYKKCSQTHECIHKKEEDYQGCLYKKNLEQGNVFYIEDRWKNQNIYFIQNGRAFKITIKDKKQWYSYALKSTQIKELEKVFDNREISYTSSLSNFKCIIDTSIADSRVVFILEDQEYVISNYNGYLIKNFTAKMILQEIKKGNIDCRIELIGQRQKYIPEEIILSKPAYKQLSIFDLVQIPNNVKL